MDAPLLFEAGLEKECDYVVGVIADKNLRMDRICQRDGLDRENAQNRISSQRNDEFFRQNCHFIIENSGNLEELKIKTEKIIRSICK